MKFLVISATGKNSYFMEWIKDNPIFDTAIVCYQDVPQEFIDNWS